MCFIVKSLKCMTVNMMKSPLAIRMTMKKI